GGMARRRIGQQLHQRQRGDRLARAGLADEGDRLALPDVERDAIDRQQLLPAMGKGDREVLDREKRRAVAHRKVFRGSKASRTASPVKISSVSMMPTEKTPDSPSQGAWMLALACDSSSPSDGEPGGRPKPRKSSEVSAVTDEERINGSMVMVATIAFGSRCRNMMVVFDTPSARAAWTYSKLRPRRNSARTRPTSATQENSSMMPSRTKKPGTSTDEMMRRR